MNFSVLIQFQKSRDIRFKPETLYSEVRNALVFWSPRQHADVFFRTRFPDYYDRNALTLLHSECCLSSECNRVNKQERLVSDCFKRSDWGLHH